MSLQSHNPSYFSFWSWIRRHWWKVLLVVAFWGACFVRLKLVSSKWFTPASPISIDVRNALPSGECIVDVVSDGEDAGYDVPPGIYVLDPAGGSVGRIVLPASIPVNPLHPIIEGTWSNATKRLLLVRSPGETTSVLELGREPGVLEHHVVNPDFRAEEQASADFIDVRRLANWASALNDGNHLVDVVARL